MVVSQNHYFRYYYCQYYPFIAQINTTVAYIKIHVIDTCQKYKETNTHCIGAGSLPHNTQKAQTSQNREKKIRIMIIYFVLTCTNRNDSFDLGLVCDFDFLLLDTQFIIIININVIIKKCHILVIAIAVVIASAVTIVIIMITHIAIVAIIVVIAVITVIIIRAIMAEIRIVLSMIIVIVPIFLIIQHNIVIGFGD